MSRIQRTSLRFGCMKCVSLRVSTIIAAKQHIGKFLHECTTEQNKQTICTICDAQMYCVECVDTSWICECIQTRPLCVNCGHWATLHPEIMRALKLIKLYKSLRTFKGLEIPQDIVEIVKEYANDVQPKAMQMAVWRMGNV